MKRGLIPLRAAGLVSAAILRTGLGRARDEQSEESLKVLADACDSEAGLSLIGRIAARRHLLELLETRFRLVEHWRRTPGILEQEVHPQIFITGVPKSGSTFLHRLLALDPASRAPRMWEVMFPLSCPVRAPSYADPRIGKAERRLNWLRRVHPELASAHPVGALIPHECGAILGYSFESNVFLDMFSIPSYETWLRNRTMDSAYQFHRNFLKHLQWQIPAERWVLKSSDHVHALNALLKAYPQAKIVFLHRDPLKVLQAASSQMTLLKGIFSNRIDLRQLGAYETRTLNDKVRKILEFRANHAELEGNFADVRYLDLAADPVGTVRGIYERFGLALSAEAEARMAAFADAERQKLRGDSFSLADFTLGPEQQQSAHFDLYCERFDIEREAL